MDSAWTIKVKVVSKDLRLFFLFLQVNSKIPVKQVIMSQLAATVISAEPENQVAPETQESGSEEKERTEMEVDENADEEQEEETEKHVGFEVEEEEDVSARPNRLHRRDTPHHLKDRRINVNLDHNKVASIIAQVRLDLFVFVMNSETISYNKESIRLFWYVKCFKYLGWCLYAPSGNTGKLVHFEAQHYMALV
jgi:hypothetical protein